MDEWSFVALTHDGKTLVLYVDGEVVADLDVGKPDFTQQHDGGSIWLTPLEGRTRFGILREFLMKSLSSMWLSVRTI